MSRRERSSLESVVTNGHLVEIWGKLLHKKTYGNNNAHPSSNNNSVPVEVELDRRKEFVVDDNPLFGPQAFFASKFIGARLIPRRKRRLTTVAVREYWTKRFSRVLRFRYTVPAAVRKSLNTWIPVLRTY